MRLMQHTPGIKIVLMAIMPRGRGLEHEWVETFEELAPLPNQYVSVCCYFMLASIVCLLQHIFQCYLHVVQHHDQEYVRYAHDLTEMLWYKASPRRVLAGSLHKLQQSISVLSFMPEDKIP